MIVVAYDAAILNLQAVTLALATCLISSNMYGTVPCRQSVPMVHAAVFLQKDQWLIILSFQHAASHHYTKCRSSMMETNIA